MLPSELYEREILPRLNREEVFADLEPERKGRSLKCICPECGEKEAYIYDDKFVLRCNRANKCGASRTIIEHLGGGTMPLGKDYVDLIRKLAAKVNVIFPEREMTAEQIEKVAAAEALSKSLEDMLAKYMQNFSLEHDNYLAARGIHHAESHEFGSDVSTPGWQGRLIHPIRDRYGRLRALQGRSTDGREPKYLFTDGADIDSLGALGLDVALRSKEGRESLILVEGMYDVFKFRESGISNVVAIGGNTVNNAKWSVLATLPTKQFILALDNDEAGRRGTLASIKNAEEGLGLALSVLDPESLGDCKDPDEYATKYGANKFIELLDDRKQHCLRYLAYAMSKQYEPQNDNKRLAYLEACIEYDTSITDPKRTLELTECFWPEVFSITGSDPEVVLNYRDQIREKKTQDRERDIYLSVAKEIEQGRNTDLLELRRKLSKALEQAFVLGQKKVEAVRSVADELNDHKERMAKWAGQEFIGLATKTLPTLDKSLLGLRGLILLAAQPNVGKTILACQLALDVLRSNDDACVIYLSLDMPRWDLYTRLLCRLAGQQWKDFVLGSQREINTKAPFTESDVKRKDAAYTSLAAVSSRLLVLDHRTCPLPTADLLLRRAATLKEQTGTKRIMFVIDYLQIWPTPEEMRKDLRAPTDEDKWRIGVMLQLKDAIENDPVFVISEARKPKSKETWGADMADIMGSARGAYSPDTVLLFNLLTDQELLEAAEIREGKVQAKCEHKYRPGESDDVDELPNKEKIKRVKVLRKALKEADKNYALLRMAKIRDGSSKEDIPLTVYWQQARFLEGIQ